MFQFIHLPVWFTENNSEITIKQLPLYSYKIYTYLAYLKSSVNLALDR